MGFYDVLVEAEVGFKMIPLVLAMSKEDAMHIVEIKGYEPLDATLSLDNAEVYRTR